MIIATPCGLSGGIAVDDVICGSDAGAPPYLSRHRHWNSVTTNSGANDDAETTERAQLSRQCLFATSLRRG